MASICSTALVALASSINVTVASWIAWAVVVSSGTGAGQDIACGGIRIAGLGCPAGIPAPSAPRARDALWAKRAGTRGNSPSWHWLPCGRPIGGEDPCIRSHSTLLHPPTGSRCRTPSTPHATVIRGIHAVGIRARRTIRKWFARSGAVSTVATASACGLAAPHGRPRSRCTACAILLHRGQRCRNSKLA